MADRMYAKITIGGRISAHTGAKLIETLKDEGLLYNENNLSKYKQEDGTYEFEDEEVSRVRFEDLESFCVKNGVSFERNSDAKYEYNAEKVWWQPGMEKPQEDITDTDYNVQVSLDTLNEMIEKIKKDNPDNPLDVLSKSLQEEHPQPLPVPPLIIEPPYVGEKDITVYSKDNQKKGKTTGGSRTCGIDGCLGRCVAVRWEDKTLTYPCTKGMGYADNGTAWRIA